MVADHQTFMPHRQARFQVFWAVVLALRMVALSNTKAVKPTVWLVRLWLGELCGTVHQLILCRPYFFSTSWPSRLQVCDCSARPPISLIVAVRKLESRTSPGLS